MSNEISFMPIEMVTYVYLHVHQLTEQRESNCWQYDNNTFLWYPHHSQLATALVGRGGGGLEAEQC